MKITIVAALALAVMASGASAQAPNTGKPGASRLRQQGARPHPTG